MAGLPDSERRLAQEKFERRRRAPDATRTATRTVSGPSQGAFLGGGRSVGTSYEDVVDHSHMQSTEPLVPLALVGRLHLKGGALSTWRDLFGKESFWF